MDERKFGPSMSNDKGDDFPNHNEVGDTAQKSWALMILFRVKKWVCSNPGPHSNMSTWRIRMFLSNLLPQHLSQ